MNPFSFFERKVCLTLGPDYPLAEAEFDRVGLTEVLRFDALPDIGPHQSFSKSEREILWQFWQSGASSLLHLEDDCIFRSCDHLGLALSELPDDWDIVYLGANLICWNNGEIAPERYSEHLFRVRAAWTTHCVGYSRKGAQYLLERQPGFSEIMFDNWMSTQLPYLNAYCVAPMVAYQRPRFSSIWGREDDYTPIFEASEERLK
jgi:hypothetical protein